MHAADLIVWLGYLLLPHPVIKIHLRNKLVVHAKSYIMRRSQPIRMAIPRWWWSATGTKSCMSERESKLGGLVVLGVLGVFPFNDATPMHTWARFEAFLKGKAGHK